MRNRIIFGGSALTLAAMLAGGCGGKGGTPGGDGGVVGTTRDFAYIRVSRAIQTTEPEGLRNLEVFASATKKPVTRATTLESSVCQTWCALSPDRSRLLYVKGTAEPALMSVPVDGNYEPNFAQETRVNEQGRPLAQTAVQFIPPGNRVLFIQEDSPGGAGADGGAEPPTYSLASAPIAGGTLTKHRSGYFLPSSSTFTTSMDGSKIVFSEVLGASNQLSLFLINASGGTSSSTPPFFKWEIEGSAEFGGEIMALSPDGKELVVASQRANDRVIFKVTTDGRASPPPLQLRIGPSECGAAASSEVCLVQSKLHYSQDGRTVYFLGGRAEGIDLVSQLFKVSSDLGSAPVALTSFTAEVLSAAINRARNRVVWSTQSGQYKRNNAIFGADFTGNPLNGTPEKLVDDTGISFHYQEPVFLE
jgi:hypothetical protein